MDDVSVTCAGEHPSFLRNLVQMGGGTVGAQAIQFLAMLLLARVYTPEAFSVRTSLLAWVSLSLPLMSLRYEMAVVETRDEKDAVGLVVLNLHLILFMGISPFLPESVWKSNRA